MRTHTSAFKNTIKLFGRELDSIITYEENGNTIELGNEQLNSVSPHYEGGILKSVMKVLDIDSNADIPLDTVINYQFGVKVRNDDVEDYRDNYDYIDFGNYVVYKSEKQEDSNSYKIICYDKMLYAMKDYEIPTTNAQHTTQITYPITIRNYISAICNHLGLIFANSSDIFANYNKEIPNELYLSYNSSTQTYSSLGYTFRDVLDELAEVTGSSICINNDDELEIRYINDTNDTIDEEYIKDVNVNFGEQFGTINTVILSRANETDEISLSEPVNLPDADKFAIKIIDNQIMNGTNRANFMSDILSKLYGLNYSINDYTSTGICYLELLDKYKIIIGNNIYNCLMLNDDITITSGLKETIFANKPDNKTTNEYITTSKSDREDTRANLIVDKALGSISLEVAQKLDSGDFTKANIVAKINDNTSQVQIDADNVDINANDVLNILAGNTINLTSKNIIIDSTNFGVNANGDMRCANASITGGSISLGAVNESTGKITIINQANSSQYTTISPLFYDIYVNNAVKAEYAWNQAKIINTAGTKYGLMSSGGFSAYSNNTLMTYMNTEGTVGCQRLNAGNIDCGNEWITPVANTPTSKHVDFNKTFSSVPIVVATPESAVIGSTVRGVSVANVTTTGFDIYIYRTNTTSTNVNWIAMN